MTEQASFGFDQAEDDAGSDAASTRALLDQLFSDSRLYTQTEDYYELLDFVVRLPHIAPFNALLLQVQKPGLRFAASAHDWEVLFGRWPKPHARPLLILWPFGPVALVYDVMDTEGSPLPRDVRSFYARGPVNHDQIDAMLLRLAMKHIHFEKIDSGDQRAGSIVIMARPEKPKDYSDYKVFLNGNHEPAVQFVTIAHELAHLFLGHLGQDFKLHIPGRTYLSHSQMEVEAESVAYLVSERNGVHGVFETYLASYVTDGTAASALDVYQIMRAAGQVETILNLARGSKFR